MNPVIITGVYGAGKTEFCVNYALSLPKPVKLADMDILNPYFRSREKAEFLAQNGVEVIGNLTGNSGNTDVPAISGEVIRAVLAKDRLVVDLAGSATGLHALAYIREILASSTLASSAYAFWLCVNVFRLESSSTEKILSFIKTAEEVSGLRINGLVNNSHMLRETTAAEVLLGQEITLEVSEKTNIPVKFTFLQEDIYNEIQDKLVSPALTFKKMLMREDWQ